jgi:hypothetical protein
MTESLLPPPELRVARSLVARQRRREAAGEDDPAAHSHVELSI